MTDRATTSVFEDALCEVAVGTHRFVALGAGTGRRRDLSWPLVVDRHRVGAMRHSAGLATGEVTGDAAGDLDLLDPLPDDAVDDAHQLQILRRAARHAGAKATHSTPGLRPSAQGRLLAAASSAPMALGVPPMPVLSAVKDRRYLPMAK